MIQLPIKGSNVCQAQDIVSDLQQLTLAYQADKVFILTDEGSFRHCYPTIETALRIDSKKVIIIPQGDINKNIQTAEHVWKVLSNNGADRHSVLINLGGGMPCDLGGFCASSFKRGIHFINIPTTLLAMVDASIGGKTGINLDGLKNEIGFFADPDTVLLHTGFLKSLNTPNLLSGWAELLKHALIHSNDTWLKLKQFDIRKPEWNKLTQLVNESIAIKDYFVQNDPKEQNIRKALNFGHTFGHAFETHAMNIGQPLLHGYAVAFGMICELYMSHKHLNLPIGKVEELSTYINELYGILNLNPSDDDTLIELMKHDKKNNSNKINFTLLNDFGRIEINCHADSNQIISALDYYRDITGQII